MPSPKTAARDSSLSREKIINVAYRIARKDPANALSMRRLAAKLKVTPMAIYKYFEDKDDLTAAVIDMHMEQSSLIPEEIDQSNWREWIRESCLRMWDAFDDSPAMVQYMSNAAGFGPAVLAWQNEVLKVLITAGLSPKQALTAHAAMAELATGSTILVPIRRQGVEGAFPMIWKDLNEGKVPANLDEIDESGIGVEYPWLLLCGQAMIEDMQDSRVAFENELELILDSLEARIETNSMVGKLP